MNAVTFHNYHTPLSSLCWAGPEHAGRALLEQTVKVGFANAFSADLHEFYPVLSRLNTPQGSCVLGLRKAKLASLFVEQYLQNPIESFLPECHARGEIAELGNLYSTHRSATLGHFIIVAYALLALNIRFLTFTGTAQVRRLMALCQVPICELSAAEPDCVASAKDYGSYYEADPKVCVVDLNIAKQVITQTKLFDRLASFYLEEISELTQGLSL